MTRRGIGPALALTLAFTSALWGCDDDDGPAPDAAAPDAAIDGGEPEPDPDMAPVDMAPAPRLDANAVTDAGPDPDAAPDLAPPDAAPLDCGACPGNQICDTATGACVEAGDCAADVDCLDGRHCADGACVDDCFEDAACPGTRLCDLETGRCPEPAMCLAPEDCDPGRLCVDGACADACGPEAPCPGNQTCGDDGRCVEGDGCADDVDCAGARICLFGACAEPCVEDADCPGTRTCDPISGRCPEPAACFAAGDCDPGRVCDDMQCAAVCGGDGDCPGRQLCGGDGRCVEPAACEAAVDCRGARICLDGRCADPCRENADCPGALVCDVASGLCGEAPQGCVLDADCVGDRLCVGGLCADPECAENADCPDACVDRLCGAVPVACAGDGACEAGALCGAGVCADPNPCAEDADCGGLRPVCLLGRCVACRGDLDCAPSEFCDGGRCVFLDGCAEDADCPGRRQCADGRCPPGPCAGDRFDGERDPSPLAARTWTDLVLCDGDVDRYRVELAPGEGLRIAVRHDPADGDLALRLTAPDAPALIYAASDGAAGLETVGLPPSPAAQVVDVEIDGRVGYDTRYALTVERLPADACPPDPNEVPFANDARDRATPIGPAPPPVALCPEDTDWLGFDAAAGTALTVVAVSEGQPEILLVDLLDPADEVLASALIEDRALVLRGGIAETGPHALRLAGADAPITLDLTLETTATPAAAPAACAEAAEHPLDRAAPLPPTLPVDRFELGCAPGAAAPDHVVRLRLAGPRTVSLTARPDDRQTTLAVRRACADPATEVECVFGADAEVELAGGEWFIFVESSGAVPQTLAIRAR